VPPDIPVIYNANGQVATNPVGPFNEGADLVLVCEVTGGKFGFKYTIIVLLQIIKNIVRHRKSKNMSKK